MERGTAFDVVAYLVNAINTSSNIYISFGVEGFTTWEGSQELANHIMEEFWQQGDDETSKGLTTLDNIEPILDRRQSVNLPSLEVRSKWWWWWWVVVVVVVGGGGGGGDDDDDDDNNHHARQQNRFSIEVRLSIFLFWR